MRALFRFPDAVEHDPGVQRRMLPHRGALGEIAQHWFALMRRCGDDTRELLHDGRPTACVGDAAFGYVDAFTAHVNVGVFQGAALDDPAGLLEGRGKFMRHGKLRPGVPGEATAQARLIEAAYADVPGRLQAG